ncbi:hypothetical protein BKA80DRAFT_22245 [Phyllosticta citrichinensis]
MNARLINTASVNSFTARLSLPFASAPTLSLLSAQRSKRAMSEYRPTYLPHFVHDRALLRSAKVAIKERA